MTEAKDDSTDVGAAIRRRPAVPPTHSKAADPQTAAKVVAMENGMFRAVDIECCGDSLDAHIPEVGMAWGTCPEDIKTASFNWPMERRPQWSISVWSALGCFVFATLVAEYFDNLACSGARIGVHLLVAGFLAIAARIVISLLVSVRRVVRPTFEKRCFDEFWSKQPQLIEGLTTRGAKNAGKELAEWQRFADCWDAPCKNGAIAVPIVSDNPAYDLARLDYVFHTVLGRKPLRYTADKGLYCSVMDVHEQARYMPAAEKRAMKERLDKIAPHTHVAAEDARRILLQFFEVRAIMGASKGQQSGASK